MVHFPRDTDPDTTVRAGFHCGASSLFVSSHTPGEFGQETTSDRSNRLPYHDASGIPV